MELAKRMREQEFPEAHSPSEDQKSINDINAQKQANDSNVEYTASYYRHIENKEGFTLYIVISLCKYYDDLIYILISGEMYFLVLFTLLSGLTQTLIVYENVAFHKTN